ncbi:MAG: cellulase family glycosylhydrolase [Oscillospiraceae bacterium]
MNRIFKKILASAAACAVMLGFAGSFPAQLKQEALTASAASVIDLDSLTALNFAKAMGAGWNLGNTLDSYDAKGMPSETGWCGTAPTKALIKAVHDAGFTTIRIPVTYMAKIGAAPDYTIDAAWLDTVQKVVDYAYEYDMFVIINIHHDGSTGVGAKNLWLNVESTDQTTVNKKLGKVWEQIADRFQDYDKHLIFESMNEVMESNNYNAPKKAATYANINKLNQTFVNTVRAAGSENASRYLLVPGYNTNISYTNTASGFVLPTDTATNKLMVSVHCYDPYNFALDESASSAYLWGTSGAHTAGWGDQAYLTTLFGKMKTNYIDKGIPVVMGEYGAVDKSWINKENAASRVVYNGAVSATAKSAGIVPVYWDNGWNGKNGFALFNRATAAETQSEIIDAIVAPFQGVVSGLEMTASSATTLSVKWVANSDASSYDVYRKTGSGSYALIKNVKTASYKDTGLTAGTTYSYKIKSHYTTIAGESKLSAYSATLTVATAPAKVTALKAAATDSTGVTLSWRKAPNATGYAVYKYNTAAKTWTLLKSLTSSATSFKATVLKQGTTYKFAVKSIIKTSGGTSISDDATVSGTPKFSAVSFTLTAGSKKATVKWSGITGASGYRVYYKTSSGGELKLLKDTTSKSYTKTGLTAGKKYYFTVKAYRTVGSAKVIGSGTIKTVTAK